MLSTEALLISEFRPSSTASSFYESENLTSEFEVNNSITVLFNDTGKISQGSQPPLPYPLLLGIAIYLTVVGLLSTFGNVLFILTVMQWRYLRNNSHMLLLLNMAVSDLAISITGYPYTTISCYVGEWIFGPFICQLYGFLCFTFSQVSMNTLVAVSIFRYVAICHPHKKHFLTSRTSVWALLVVWCHALFWTISPLVGWSSYTFELTRISCSINWKDRSFTGVIYAVATTTFCYMSQIVILMWCYKRIFLRLGTLRKNKVQERPIRRPARTRTISSTSVDVSTILPSSSSNLGESHVQQSATSTQNTGHSHSHSHSHTQNQENTAKRADSLPGLHRCHSLIVFSFTAENLTEVELHVLWMNIAMVVAFIIFWTPYTVISWVSAFYDKLSPIWYIFPLIFAKTSCMANPILYGMTNSFLRKQLLLVLRGFLGLTSPIEDFEVMRQRQQDVLYNKGGIYVTKRTAAISHCPCEGCTVSRKEIRLMVEHQHQRRDTISIAPTSTSLQPADQRKKKKGKNNGDERVKMRMKMKKAATIGQLEIPEDLANKIGEQVEMNLPQETEAHI